MDNSSLTLYIANAMLQYLVLFYVLASFMLFAWMFLAVISIFIARYSRSLWKGLKIFNKDAWFQVQNCELRFAACSRFFSVVSTYRSKIFFSERFCSNGISISLHIT